MLMNYSVNIYLGKYLVKHIHTEIKQNQKTQKPA